MKKTIKQIIPSELVNMGGHILRQPLPVAGVEQIDPFLLIHHWDGEVPKGKKQNDAGVGPHPHRGFSPVTFIYEGDVHHRDSLGGNAIVEKGGTQWMFAGRGLTHSERPSKKLLENGGRNEIIQFWVNTPAAHKMEEPYYKPLSDEETPKIQKEGVQIAVVAGEYEGVKAPIPTFSPQTLLRISMNQSAQLDVKLPQSYNTIVYVVKGKVQINGQEVSKLNMAWFNRDGIEIELKATENAELAVLSGEPIGEKVSQYGPFVMNSQTEVLEALRDAQVGKMGVLIEEFD
jgi:hypothetical protein